MDFIKKPVTGMRDILPDEMELRVRLQGIIRETYQKYGFTEIETPLIEHIENLTGKQGGENEKLIFKILKRGENLLRGLKELKSTGNDLDEDGKHLVEEGLRYDLTLPLSRYYAANLNHLPQPFKALQIGPVFRADRPQKGRFRQFTQCDIDILGDATNLAEKELIMATSEALDRIGFMRFGFYICINDRRLLMELIKYAGMPLEDAEEILIILDKADKIGADGVDNELMEKGYTKDSIARLREALESCRSGAEGVRQFAAKLGTNEASKAGENVADIMESVTGLDDREIKIIFDPTLVRGMGYYTGTIFEVKTDAFSSSVGGGGRYDRMIGRFTGQDTPAVGFSIGFERIMSILLEDTKQKPEEGNREAWLIEKGMPNDRIRQIFNEASAERKKGKRILIVWMAKNKKFQKEGIASQGYSQIREFYCTELKR